MKNLYGNVLCAVDVETTGVVFGYNEVIQIACVPLDIHMKPSKEHRFFYLNIAPTYPERQSMQAKMKHGLDAHKLAEECLSQEQAADMLDDWFTGLNLPSGKRLIPLAHNYAFERGMLSHWLGVDTFDAMWHIHPRDTFTFATSLNDVAAWQGRTVPFPQVGLTSMCRKLGIPLDNAHDALADCLATAELYRNLLSLFG